MPEKQYLLALWRIFVKLSHLRHLPSPSGAEVLDSELWFSGLISKEEMVVRSDAAHCPFRLDFLVIEDDAVVGEAEAGAARHTAGIRSRTDRRRSNEVNS